MADAADVANEFMDANLAVALHKTTTSASIAQKGSKICIDCDEPIPAKRREIAPFARRCIECQNDVEAQNKHVRR